MCDQTENWSFDAWGGGACRSGTAAALVGATAVVFSGPSSVGTASGVTWPVWAALDPTGTWRYRYGLGAGLLVGPVSHICLGFVLAGLPNRRA